MADPPPPNAAPAPIGQLGRYRLPESLGAEAATNPFLHERSA